MPQVKELDGLRAIAVLLVFVSHMGLGHLVPGGFGVTIFFFLSGYLITSLMRAEASNAGRVSFTGFYLRRTLRIIPPLWITLMFGGALVAAGLIQTKIDWLAVPSQFFFLTNYDRLWNHHGGFPSSPLWSLGVEEHFYLLFPLFYSAVLLKVSGRKAVIICLAICAVVLGIRLLNIALLDDYSGNYIWSHTRVDSILFGSCLAMWRNPVFDKNAWRPTLLQFLGACALLLATLTVRSPAFQESLRYTLQGIGLYGVFAFILHPNKLTSPILNWGPAQLIGRYSYTIYLVHVVFINLVRNQLPEVHGLARAAIVVALTLAYAALMFRLVERPLGKVRSRLHREAEAKRVLATATPSPTG
jgi:peptidoglycan/LPS O-acetylase OafA/YrhL